MLYSAKITIKDPHEGIAGYLKSIERNTERSKVKTGEEKGEAVITIEASDATALRAAMNGITQSLSVFETAQKDG